MNTEGTRRWWAVVALALSLLAVGIDATVLNLALPTLATTLHASNSDLQWFVTAYNLVFAVMLLPAGLLGDRFGRKKLLLGALTLFGGASFACAYAGSASGLILARAVLGLGGAFLLPLCLSALPVLFSDAERPRAVTVLLGATVVAYPVGPILGGWLLTNFWWGSVFLLNVPIVAVALLAVAALLPESRSATPPGLDPLGILTSSVALGSLTYGVIAAGENGWGDPGTLSALAMGGAFLGAFVLWEQRQARRPGARPLMDLALFRAARFSWGTILATTVSFAMFGLLFTMPQYFQVVRRADALGAGVRLLPLIGGLIVGGGVGDRLGRRLGAKLTVAFGFGLMAAGLFAGAATGLASGDWFTAAWIAVVGAGLGFAMPTATDAALGSLPADRSGVGSALIQAIRQVGGIFGVALLGLVLQTAYRDRLDVTGLPVALAGAARKGVAAGVAVAQQLQSPALLESARAAFVGGMDLMLAVCGGVALAGAALALAFLPGGAPAVENAPAEGARSEPA